MPNQPSQVFTNQSLFSTSMFRYAQLSFASYHFFTTGMLLYLLSRPRIGFFEPKRGKLLEMLPLSGVMCLNVILQNFSFASSIPFYRISRVLLTTTVAAMKFSMYQKMLPRTAVYALVPICVGVGMATYLDALSHGSDDSKKTSLLGVLFAFSGVVCSSIYTIWVAVYHTKFRHEQHATALEPGSDRIGNAAGCDPLDRQLPPFARGAVEWVDVGAAGEFVLQSS